MNRRGFLTAIAAAFVAKVAPFRVALPFRRSVNQIIPPGIVAAEMLKTLESHLVMSHHVNRLYEAEFSNTGAKIGETINIRKPIRYIGRDGNA
jgi:hypothetical protein